MSTQILPITEARAKLPQLVKAADRRFERTVITSNGKPTAVLMSYEEFEAWEETLEVLSDASAMRAMHAADEELADNRTLSYEAVFGHKQPKPKKTK